MSSETPELAQGGTLSWAQRKAAHRNTVKSTQVTLRGDLLDAVELLEEKLEQVRADEAGSNRTPKESLRIAEEIQKLEAQARESEVVFSFEALGRGAMARLQAQHPPTDAQRKEFGEELDHNPETFPPALMSATCVVPAELHGDLAEWTDIHENWSNGQVTRLWRTCMLANALVADTPKSELASETLRQHSSGSS